ncbi:hypothetical protein EC988_003584 [Linderina pennispora]|nr:hypothetical protein EC988_003584 [Linderina pennispora]
MLRVIQECFNSADPQVLVAALMQWRCLVYAFQWEGRVGFKKCVQLIMTPIVSILSNKESTVEVRLACVRCWATLVYALGDGVATHTEILIKPITKAVVADGSIEAMEVVARVLTALLNQFVLSPDKIPKFVVSPMIIGTTTLAAGDGKSLAETHGPFSSVDEFTKGDNTQVLGQYVVGVPVESASGVVPIVIEYIGGYIAALCSGKSTMPTGGLPSFVCLCDAACTSLNALDKDTNEDISSYLASIWSVFVTTAPICPGQDPCGCPLVESENPKSPHEVLFYAITNSVGTRLAQTVSLGPDVVDRVFPPADDSETKETTAVPEFTSALAALLPATEAEPTIPPRPIPVAHLTNAMTLTLWLNDAIGRNGGISASCWRSLESSSVWHGQNTLDHSALAANLGMRIAFHLLQFIDSANRDGLAEALVSVLEQLSLPSDVNCYGLDSGSDLECLAYVFFKRIILFAGSPWFADALLKQPPITAPCDSTNESEETSTVKHWALMWKCADDAVVRLIKETNLVVHQPTAAIFARLARESVKSADAAEWVPHACSISVLLGIAAVGSACGGTWTAPESISAFAEAEVTDEKSRHCFYLLGISLFDQTISMLDKIKDPQTVRQILCQLGGVLDKVLESDPAASTPLPQDELASFLVAAEHSPILDSKTTASGLVKALCGILESDALVKKAPKVIQEPADVDMAPTQDPPAVLPEISGVSGQPSQPSQPKKRSRVSPQASSDCTSEQSTPTKKRKSKRSKKRTPPPTLSSVLGQLEALLMDTGSQSLEELCQVQGRLTGIQQSLCEVMGSKLKSQNAGQGTE